MNRLPQRAYCLLCRQWRQERLCVKRCLPERMPEASQRMVHQEDGSCAWYAAQRGVLRAEQPLPRCPEGRRMTFVHPISAHPSRLAPVRGPGASRVCSILLWYIAVVPLEPGAQDGSAASFGEACRGCVIYWLGGGSVPTHITQRRRAARNTRRTASYDTP